MRNLRNRPFLMITKLYSPHAGQDTGKSGWATSNEAKWDVNESMIILDHVSEKNLRASEIIIDILENKLIKDRNGNIADENLVIEYYAKRYANDIKNALVRWVSLHPNNLKTLNEVKAKYLSIDSLSDSQES